MRYKAFISYSHADAKWAKWIQRGLERYRVPDKLVAKHELATNRLNPIFLDRDELSSSSSLSTVIQNALGESENLIVVCSPASAKSHWVNEEIRTYRALGRGDRIFCLIVDGEDGTYFPPALLDDEPLGVDVRPHADGKQNSKLKIISSLIDVPFASLKDREQRRRTRLFATAATAALAVAGVMTALAISAVLASREAEENRLLATEALEDAEAVAEFLATMLTEIDPEAMGQTIVDGAQGEYNSTDLARRLLDEHVLEKATVAVTSQFAERPAIGARLSDSIGASYHAIGLYDKAIERFGNAVSLYRAEYGDNDYRVVGAEGSLGMAYLYEGQLDDAVVSFENARQVGLASLGKSHEQTLAATNGLAMTYTDMDRFEDARTLLEEVSAIMIDTKGREDPYTIDVRSNLGWTLYQMGEYELAETITKEQYELRVKVLGPEEYETMSTLNNLALIYARTERYEEAEAAHRKEWEISQRKMGADHPEVLISMLNLGRVMYKSGKMDAAGEMLTDAMTRARGVLPEVHPLLAAIVTSCGEVALEQGDRETALTHFLEVQTIYQQMFPPGHPRFNRLNELLAEARS